MTLTTRRRDFFFGLTVGLAVSVVIWLSSSEAAKTTTTTSSTTTKTMSIKSPQSPQPQPPQQQLQKLKLIFIHVGKTGGSSGRCMLHPLLTEGSCGKYSHFYHNNQNQKNVTFTSTTSRGHQQQQDTTAIFDQTFAVCHMQGCSILVPDSTTTDDDDDDDDGTNSDDTKKKKAATTVLHRKEIAGRGIPGEWIVQQMMMDWRNTGVIVSVRNPVDRLVSWFLYGRQHFYQIIMATTKMKEPEFSRSKIYRCYTEFADVAEAIRIRSVSTTTTTAAAAAAAAAAMTTTEQEEESMKKNKTNKNMKDESGIASRKNNNSSSSSSNASVAGSIGGNSNNIIDPECQEAAYRCLVGTRTCTSEHNRYNYKHYLQPLLHKMNELQNKQHQRRNGQQQSISEKTGSGTTNSSNNILKVYVVRNEYKWDDFYTINLMLGGTATSFHPSSFFGSGSGDNQLPHIRNSAAGQNKTVPDRTRPALCKILCDEIHEYVAILRRSVNLHESQYQQSMDELYASCGLRLVDSNTSAAVAGSGGAPTSTTTTSNEQQHGHGRLRRHLSSSSSSSLSSDSPTSRVDDPLTELCGTNPYL